MLKVLTAGESHGPGLTAVIDGLPSGLRIDREYINNQLKRRQAGYGRGGRMRIEEDRVKIISGVRGGITLGTPVALYIENMDYRNWQGIMGAEAADLEVKQVLRPRPGHADLAGAMKYRHEDMRNVLERSSARETAARVAVGAVCRKLLEEFRIKIYSQVLAIGTVSCSAVDIGEQPHLAVAVDESPVGCADPEAARLMMEAIDEAKASGESLGGCFEIEVHNVPPGLGSYSEGERRLDARLAAAVMSIPAIKAVEIGDGVKAAGLPGSQVHDQIYYNEEQGLFRTTNTAGGVEGGVSNGEPIRIRGYMKPIPTLYKPLMSVNTRTWEPETADIERSDVCAVPAARIVGEAVVSLVLADEMLRKFGGDTLQDMKNGYIHYLEYLEKVWRWKRTLY